jgi:acid phosphatase type 7
MVLWHLGFGRRIVPGYLGPINRKRTVQAKRMMKNTMGCLSNLDSMRLASFKTCENCLFLPHVVQGIIMENLRHYFKQTHWQAVFILFLALSLWPFNSRALPIGEVRGNVEAIRSLQNRFQFAIIGDSRDGDDVYAQLLRGILKRKPSFLIHLGDMVPKPGESEWRAFFDASRGIDIPFIPVIGNHDCSGGSGDQMFRRLFTLPDGHTYYAFETGAGSFVVLDSEMEKGKITGDQRGWLEKVLSFTEKPKFVFLHRPLFPPEGSLKRGKAMDRNPADRDNLHRLFASSGVKAVFAADDHRYHRQERDRISYVITGGGGAPVYASRRAGGFYHYIWVSVHDQELDAEVVDLEGEAQDRFTLRLK